MEKKINLLKLSQDQLKKDEMQFLIGAESQSCKIVCSCSCACPSGTITDSNSDQNSKHDTKKDNKGWLYRQINNCQVFDDAILL